MADNMLQGLIQLGLKRFEGLLDSGIRFGCLGRNQTAFDSLQFRVHESEIESAGIFAEFSSRYNRRLPDANREVRFLVRTDNETNLRKCPRDALFLSLADIRQQDDHIGPLADTRQGIL